MARYIDADALLENSQTYTLEFGEYIGEDAREVDIVFVSSINDAPTADVAPVVRCQGCELCKPQDIKNTYDNKTERGLFCHYWQQKVYPDDFCSYGERKAVE